MCLCNNCSRSMFGKTCSIPTENEKLYMWKKQREVINDDGTCDYYKKIRVIDKVKKIVFMPYYYITRKFEMVRDFFNYNVIKRIKYKFDIRDSWNLNTSISDFIVPRLKYFIESKPMGVPGVLLDRKFIEDNNLTQYFNGELQDEWFNHDFDSIEPYNAWINILNAMLETFEYNSRKHNKDYDYMKINDYGEYELDKDMYEEIREMNNEGLRLFSIFFNNLWD